MTLDGVSSVLFVGDVEQYVIMEDEPQEEVNFEPKKFVVGKSSKEDLSKAEKWLLEMQLSEDPLRIPKKKMANLTVPPNGQSYDMTTKEFVDLFENIEHLCIRSIKLTGNSYGLETCIWLSRNLLKKCKNLQIIDFSDMFENRTTDEINKCVYVLLNAVKEYKILDFNIS